MNFFAPVSPLSYCIVASFLCLVLISTSIDIYLSVFYQYYQDSSLGVSSSEFMSLKKNIIYVLLNTSMFVKNITKKQLFFKISKYYLGNPALLGNLAVDQLNLEY